MRENKKHAEEQKVRKAKDREDNIVSQILDNLNNLGQQARNALLARVLLAQNDNATEGVNANENIDAGTHKHT